jgi:hypothetical protein
MKSEVSDQRRQLEKLSKNPEKAIQEIENARSSFNRQSRETEVVPDKVYVPPPPTFVDFMRNRPSTASAEFHEYKKIMRKEMDRKERQASEEKAEREAEEFAERSKSWKNIDEEKTQKNRERRKKRKLGKGAKQIGKDSGSGTELGHKEGSLNIPSSTKTEKSNSGEQASQFTNEKSETDVENTATKDESEAEVFLPNESPANNTARLSTPSVKIVDDYF